MSLVTSHPYLPFCRQMPIGKACPTDYRWKDNQNRLEPDWYPGNSVPESVTATSADDGERIEAPSKMMSSLTMRGVRTVMIAMEETCEEAANVFY